MPLQAILESLDDVSVDVRYLYTKRVVQDQRTGRDTDVFVLDIGGAENHPEVVALRNLHTRMKDDNFRLKVDNANLTAQFTVNLPSDREVNQTLAKLKEAEPKLPAREKFTHSTPAGDGLTTRLVAAGVDAKFLPAVSAFVSQDVRVVLVRGGVYRAVVFDKYGGERELADYIELWAADEGKIFLASERTAASANDDNKRPSDSGPNPFAKDTWNMTNQGAVLKAVPAKADHLAKSAGHKARSARRSAAK